MPQLDLSIDNFKWKQKIFQMLEKTTDNVTISKIHRTKINKSNYRTNKLKRWSTRTPQKKEWYQIFTTIWHHIYVVYISCSPFRNVSVIDDNEDVPFLQIPRHDFSSDLKHNTTGVTNGTEHGYPSVTSDVTLLSLFAYICVCVGSPIHRF